MLQLPTEHGLSHGELILLTGPPGSGKTSIAQILMASFARAVNLHSDDFWHFIQRGWIEPWRAEAHAQNQAVIEALASAAVRYAVGGYAVVLDGIVGPWFLEPFRREAGLARIGVHYVVLRPLEDIAVARACARAAPALRSEEPVRHMHRAFQNLGELERHVIDNSSHHLDDTVAIILRGLHEQRFALPAASTSQNM